MFESERPIVPQRRRWLAACLLLPWLGRFAQAQAADADAQVLLADSDAVRNLPGSFSVRNTLTEFRDGRQSARSILTVYARPAREGGQYDNLIRFEAPARDAGKLMLRNGLDLWFYDPATRASVRISPQQRLLGQASNGDVMTTRLARDYQAAIVGEESLDDGDGRSRQTLRLHLRAVRADVVYPRVDYWIDPVSRHPLMADYRSADERLLKRAYFRKFEQVVDRERPTETVIVDGLNPAWVTLMQVSAQQVREVPEHWMQRDFLARFEPA